MSAKHKRFNAVHELRAELSAIGAELRRIEQNLQGLRGATLQGPERSSLSLVQGDPMEKMYSDLEKAIYSADGKSNERGPKRSNRDRSASRASHLRLKVFSNSKTNNHFSDKKSDLNFLKSSP